jgi:long-chain acyl-CoA synthetase
VSEVQPRLLAGDLTLLHQLSPEPAIPLAIPLMSFASFAATLPEPDYTPSAGLSRDTPLQIIFTSGTTAEPKGIVHTHGNVLASLDPLEQEIGKYLRYERFFHPLRILQTLPLSHVFGQFMGLWVPPLLAAEVHFEDRHGWPGFCGRSASRCWRRFPGYSICFAHGWRVSFQRCLEALPRPRVSR